jgi:hypothetical protein
MARELRLKSVILNGISSRAAHHWGFVYGMICRISSRAKRHQNDHLVELTFRNKGSARLTHTFHVIAGKPNGSWIGTHFHHEPIYRDDLVFVIFKWLVGQAPSAFRRYLRSGRTCVHLVDILRDISPKSWSLFL